jgi:hypothetical protein
MMRKRFAWIASIMSVILLTGQTINRAQAEGAEYQVLAAQCQTREGTATALVLLHRLFGNDLQTLAATARGAIHMVPGCSPVGGDGFIALVEAQKVADVALPRPTLILAILPGPIADFGPELTLNDGGKEKYEWAVGYGGPSGDQSAWPHTKVLSPLSAILVGSWRCFNMHYIPVSTGIVARDVQSCDLDQRAIGLFAHVSVGALVLSIEDGSRFFGGDPAPRRALANEMKRYLADWPVYQPD